MAIVFLKKSNECGMDSYSDSKINVDSLISGETP